MTEKCALLSKGFFPHCDTHLCIFCDLRPGNFLIVYLPPSSFYKFLFDFYLLSTSLPNWLLFPLWNKGPSTDYNMMEEMCGKRPHSKRDLSPELLILFKWYEFWSFHNLIMCKVCRESIMCPLYPRHQPPTSHKRCLLWPRKSLQKKRLPPYLYFANVYGIIDSASFMRQLSIFWMGGSICLHIFTHHWHFLFHKKKLFYSSTGAYSNIKDLQCNHIFLWTRTHVLAIPFKNVAYMKTFCRMFALSRFIWSSL